jgi:hypothetical protein
MRETLEAKLPGAVKVALARNAEARSVVDGPVAPRVLAELSLVAFEAFCTLAEEIASRGAVAAP